MGRDYRLYHKGDREALIESDSETAIRNWISEKAFTSLGDYELYLHEMGKTVSAEHFLRTTGDKAYQILDRFGLDKPPFLVTNKIEDVLEWRINNLGASKGAQVYRTFVGDKIDLTRFVEDVLGLGTKEDARLATAEEKSSGRLDHVKLEDYFRAKDEAADAVNHPSHYNQYEGVEIIQIVRHMSFNLGNVVKYVTRAKFKNPENELEDLKKARWYLQDEITRIEKEQG